MCIYTQCIPFIIIYIYQQIYLSNSNVNKKNFFLSGIEQETGNRTTEKAVKTFELIRAYTGKGYIYIYKSMLPTVFLKKKKTLSPDSLLWILKLLLLEYM